MLLCCTRNLHAVSGRVVQGLVCSVRKIGNRVKESRNHRYVLLKPAMPALRNEAVQFSQQACRLRHPQLTNKPLQQAQRQSGQHFVITFRESGKEPQPRSQQTVSLKSFHPSTSPKSFETGMSRCMTGSPSAACSPKQQASNVC